MTEKRPVYLSALGIVGPLGRGKEDVTANLMAGRRPGVVQRHDLLTTGVPLFVGEVGAELPAPPERLAAFASRNVALTLLAAEEIRPQIDAAVDRYGAGRIAVVTGTSTSGISRGEEAVAKAMESGHLPGNFDIRMQELGTTAEALACYLGLAGPSYSVSTACSSGSHALAAARRLLRSGLADAVVAGAADSLCRLTTNGFQALSALSAGICNPFSRNRDGTMIGEGAALFLVEREEAEVALLGVGASSDAYSMTAPQPEGTCVEKAIRAALADAGMRPTDIDYIQLHGTGTRQNDKMESKVTQRVFGKETPCSSSKGQIGHTLGAAGAMGAAHCWLTAESANKARTLPPHVWDGEEEEGLLAESLVKRGDRYPDSARGTFLCNAFGFGGSNVTLVLGRAR